MLWFVLWNCNQHWRFIKLIPIQCTLPQPLARVRVYSTTLSEALQCTSQGEPKNWSHLRSYQYQSETKQVSCFAVALARRQGSSLPTSGAITAFTLSVASTLCTEAFTDIVSLSGLWRHIGSNIGRQTEFSHFPYKFPLQDVNVLIWTVWKQGVTVSALIEASCR